MSQSTHRVPYQRPAPLDLDTVLADWDVIEYDPENPTGGPVDWWAVCGPDGIVAYFGNENGRPALPTRQDQPHTQSVNQATN